jgi:hypothetical protein
MIATSQPKDLTSPTGYCSHRNHAKCPYRPGGVNENGIALSDGGFYMCPCSCHMSQKHAVQGKRLQVSLAARKSVVAQLVSENPADPATPKVSAATRARSADLVSDGPEPKASRKPAAKQAIRPVKLAKATPKGKTGRPAKTTAQKAMKPVERKVLGKPGLNTAEKQRVRVRMALILREAKDFDDRERAYIEAHWLKYIDPDLDKARREAAAAK